MNAVIDCHCIKPDSTILTLRIPGNRDISTTAFLSYTTYTLIHKSLVVDHRANLALWRPSFLLFASRALLLQNSLNAADYNVKQQCINDE